MTFLRELESLSRLKGRRCSSNDCVSLRRRQRCFQVGEEALSEEEQKAAEEGDTEEGTAHSLRTPGLREALPAALRSFRPSNPLKKSDVRMPAAPPSVLGATWPTTPLRLEKPRLEVRTFLRIKPDPQEGMRCLRLLSPSPAPPTQKPKALGVCPSSDESPQTGRSSSSSLPSPSAQVDIALAVPCSSEILPEAPSAPLFPRSRIVGRGTGRAFCGASLDEAPKTQGGKPESAASPAPAATAQRQCLWKGVAVAASRASATNSARTRNGQGSSQCAFWFDAVLPQEASQERVFEQVGRPALAAVLEGAGACIVGYVHWTALSLPRRGLLLAVCEGRSVSEDALSVRRRRHGATGSGKTHSLLGTPFHSESSFGVLRSSRAVHKSKNRSSEEVSGELGSGDASWGLIPRLVEALLRESARLEAQGQRSVQCKVLSLPTGV